VYPLASPDDSDRTVHGVGTLSAPGTNSRSARGWLDLDDLGVATGYAFPDALSGGAACGYYGSPLILTRPTAIELSTHNLIDPRRLGFGGMTVFGGTGAVSDAVVTDLTAYLNQGVSRRQRVERAGSPPPSLLHGWGTASANAPTILLVYHPMETHSILPPPSHAGRNRNPGPAPQAFPGDDQPSSRSITPRPGSTTRPVAAAWSSVYARAVPGAIPGPARMNGTGSPTCVLSSMGVG